MREIIKARLMQYLNDNGAASVCKTHLDKMTDAVVDSLKENALKGSLPIPMTDGTRYVPVWVFGDSVMP